MPSHVQNLMLTLAFFAQVLPPQGSRADNTADKTGSSWERWMLQEKLGNLEL